MIERKTFTFDGENSADYGLYISGDSVYNAPTREMDMVSIPGRNGQLAIDMGRYENITVTYPAFVIADTQAEFREKIRRIRNWLCSKTSYQRLTDEYNPESFRLGLYKSGLEVEPIFYNRCGEFKMSFDCQPQRFLFTGEEVFTLGEWGETETYSGSIVSFEGTETTAIKSLTAQITPKQSGSGDPSPSNVRPISGYEGVNVTRCGKNLFSSSNWDQGQYDGGVWGASNQRATSGYVRIKPNVPFTVKINDSESNIVLINYNYFDENKNYLGNRVTNGDASFNGSKQTTFTIHDENAVYWRLTVKRSNEADILPSAVESQNIQLELGSTATAYEPYEGETKSISLGQTVYGGTLDVVSGKLTIDKATKTIDQNSSITKDSTGRFYVQANDMKREASSYIDHIICDKLPTIERYTLLASTTVAVTGFTGSAYIEQNWIYFTNGSSTTVADMKTWLASNPLQICYELATPIEIQLTPTEVKTLLGNNNIWADSGSVEVEIGENPYILVNPTKFEACPIFEVEGAGSLSIGDTTLTISNTGTTIIDTEMMEAYEDDNGAIISRNDDVEGGFPTLTSGINNVEADGLTSVKVTPKFWEL